MSRTPETPPGAPTTNIYEDATLRPHASAPASVTGRRPLSTAAHTPPKSQSQLADEKRAEALRGGFPHARPDPAPSAPPADPAAPSSQSVSQPTAPTKAPPVMAPGAKRPDPRAPYDPAKAMRERNAREAPPPPPKTLQERVAAKRTYLRPEKKLLRDVD